MEIIGETILKWSITFLLGTIIGYISTRLKKEKENNFKKEEKDKIIIKALQDVLRNILIEKYRNFKIKKEMTILDKENLDHLYNSYQALEGNGTIKELYENMEDIKIKIIKE